MRISKFFLAVLTILTVSGCANQAAKDYYMAMQTAAEAQAQKTEARYRALATVASNGDPQSAVAATMAIALTQDQVVAPQYIENQALSWARVLAGPTAAVAGLWIQADVAKNASNNNARVQLGQQTAQRDMIVGLGQQYSSGAMASAEAMANLGVAGFEALNTAGAQQQNVATAGLEYIRGTAESGFQTAENIAASGYQTVDSVATTGYQTVDSVATTGYQTSENLGTSGLQTVSSVTEIGFQSAESLGTTGIQTIESIGQTALGALSTIAENENQQTIGLVNEYSETINNLINQLSTITTP